MPDSRPVTRALDALALGLLAFAAVIARSGGFVLDIFGLTISFRTPDRTLLWFLLVVLVRILVDRKTRPLGAGLVRLLPRGGSDPFADPWAPGLTARLALASVGMAAALTVLLHEQLRHLYAVPDLGDPLFSIWRIGWVLHQLVADPMRLFDANIFYPARLTLTFSDPMIATALMSAPLLVAGVHPVAAYNLILFASFWLSGMTTYVLMERMTGSPRAAFVAGLVYATYSYRFEHYSHLELQMTHWMPLALLALHRFVATGRWIYAAALGVAGVLQLYTAMYYAVFLLIYLAVIVAVLAAMRRLDVRRQWKPMAIVVVAAGVAALPLAGAFVAAKPQKGDRPVDEVRYYSARPLDFLRAHKHSAIWHGRLLPPEPERGLFPGVAPIALAAAGVAPPFGALHAIYGAGLLVSLDQTLGFNGVSYPLMYRLFSPVRGLRVPARFAALVGLSLAIFAGLGAARILGRPHSLLRQHMVFAGLVVFVMADAWPKLELRDVWREPPDVYETLRGRDDVVLAEFPVHANEVMNIPYQYFSVWHWLPMVNGYSGFIPSSYRTIEADLLAFPAEEAIATLRARGVTHVTWNCGVRPGGCRAALARIDALDGLALVAESEWEGRPVRLYELRRETQ